MSRWSLDAVGILFTVVCLGCAGTTAQPAGAEAHDRADVAELRARLGLSLDTSSGSVVSDPSGDAWLAWVVDGVDVPLAPVTGPPDDAHAPAQVDVAGLWLVFPSSPPVALQLADQPWLWAIGTADERPVRWPAFESSDGEPVPFEPTDSESAGVRAYRAEVRPDVPGDEQLRVTPAAIEIVDADGEQLLHHHVASESWDAGRLRQLTLHNGGEAVVLVAEFERQDDGTGVEHDWEGTYRLRWLPTTGEVEVLRATEHMHDGRDLSWDYWDDVDIDFDRSPGDAEPGHACFREYAHDASVVLDADRGLSVPELAPELERSTSHLLRTEEDLTVDQARYPTLGGVVERRRVQGQLELTWFDSESRCGERIRGQLEMVTWTIERSQGERLPLGTQRHATARRTPVVFHPLSPRGPASRLD